MAPGGVEPPRADSKSAALSAELRGPEPSLGPSSGRGFEGGGWDSNPRPPGPQPGALPTELPPPSGRNRIATAALKFGYARGRSARAGRVTTLLELLHELGAER